MAAYRVLCIPSWYPSGEKPSHGIFIKRHLLEISRFDHVDVLYFDFKTDLDSGPRYVTSVVNSGFVEHVVHVNSGKGAILTSFQVIYWYLS